jgi:hypothetical protein
MIDPRKHLWVDWSFPRGQKLEISDGRGYFRFGKAIHQLMKLLTIGHIYLQLKPI